MRIQRVYGKGFAAGFLFGTAGLFLFALAALYSPIMEVVSRPFLWPGKTLAMFLTSGGSASMLMVLLFYVCTGVFYGCIGAGIQYMVRARRR